MLPLSEILTGIENDLLLSFLEIQKVKDLKIGKKIILQVKLFPII